MLPACLVASGCAEGGGELSPVVSSDWHSLQEDVTFGLKTRRHICGTRKQAEGGLLVRPPSWQVFPQLQFLWLK